MPARVQNLIFALSQNKQTNITTAATTFLRFRKLNMNMTTAEFMVENDAAEIGKGTEFVTQSFDVAQDAKGSIEKFGSSEFMTWAFAYGLGAASVSGSGPFVYTITPLDPTSTLELPYFTLVETLAEGGGNAISNLFPGCAVEEVSLSFNYGPGRQSVKLTVGFIGSGVVNSATGATVPATLAENYFLSQSMTLTVNGTNYITAKTILSGSITWKNNLMANAGYFPGSGLQNNAAVRGRLEIGDRAVGFSFQIRLLHTSTEYAQMVAQTSGSAVLSFTNGPYSTTITFGQVTITAVELGNADGLATIQVTITPQQASTLSAFLTVSSTTSVGLIAQ